ncbi:PREDICTED: migration and invasion-inhibitory protein [Chinchilla lanigera]|uniref:Migration and invasion inhibitory protein n=1 Tax=Chinchilla lanigera TaxID=34839 RepID=A0A8C2YNL4_CHILA|nr:PREDICTED: migration and invasion-inhibitory protein [Chinchilla lanigera]XP_005404023.1 PREDICTED: migration and invasion-inhibitory protein [Chinchilla lanigera]XP_005404024.1 PREDICTED: migration and invasion-inhibitory protein [Chinchilla lanigera]XP_005404026.1 PREDICTED: migration and invasion-inhibitory protein [Chinchilla lanigera]XP_005404027.1 PREDICTED: migration and invasion-inhibitory protein [Chinchilla lanigera]XP_013359758.1 PREDICTED: migration and invasion-inhibitory prote
MVETEDLMQLRLRNLGLLRQLQAGQAAVRRLVAQAASESSVDSSSSSSYDSETPLSSETSTASSSASCSQDDECRAWEPPDTHPGDPCDTAWLGTAGSGVSSLHPAKFQRPEAPCPPRPCSTPLLVTCDLEEPSASQPEPQQAQAPKSILAQQSRKCKPRVTFEEFTVPESSWRLRPYLGYDWIAGSLDSSSSVSSKPEAFFSTLQEFRDAHREECTHGHHEPCLPGSCEGGDVEKDHECVYSYRVNRRLFLVPSDPGIPCRLCGTPRNQQGPETLAEPARVQVSVPLSVLDPPHRYHVHRRKSFDASDTLALPRHCLLGWDIVPPKPEKSSAPRSLDLWSSVSEAQHRKLSATSPSRLALPGKGPRPMPVWSEPQVPWAPQ